jgi:hypothetical protein
MEQQTEVTPVSTRSVGIRYGLFGGVAGIVLFLALTLSGLMAGGSWNWIGYVITAVLIFLAHKNYKESGDGFMSYGQGIGIAFWYGLISSLVSSVFMYIYIKFVDDTFMQSIMDVQMAKMEEQGMSDDQIEQAMKFSSMFMNPESMLLFGLIGGIVGAIIIALIVTIFTQKKSAETNF